METNMLWDVLSFDETTNLTSDLQAYLCQGYYRLSASESFRQSEFNQSECMSAERRSHGGEERNQITQ